MSDPMNMIREQRSMFNPTDASMMAQEGEIRPDMSIREFFASKGIDVEGPVTQLVEMAKGEMQKADPMNKMKAIAGGPPQGQPPQGPPQMGQSPQMPQGRRPQQAPGMGGLLNQM